MPSFAVSKYGHSETPSVSSHRTDRPAHDGAGSAAMGPQAPARTDRDLGWASTGSDSHGGCRHRQGDQLGHRPPAFVGGERRYSRWIACKGSAGTRVGDGSGLLSSAVGRVRRPDVLARRVGGLPHRTGVSGLRTRPTEAWHDSAATASFKDCETRAGGQASFPSIAGFG